MTDKKKKALLIIIPTSVALVLATSITSIFVIKNKNAYETATRLVEDGEYESAKEIFKELKNYKKSKDYLNLLTSFDLFNSSSKNKSTEDFITGFDLLLATSFNFAITYESEAFFYVGDQYTHTVTDFISGDSDSYTLRNYSSSDYCLGWYMSNLKFTLADELVSLSVKEAYKSQHKVSVTNVSGFYEPGTVYVTPSVAYEGTEIKLEARAKSGYQFDQYYIVNLDKYVKDKVTTFTMLDENVEVLVYWNQK